MQRRQITLDNIHGVIYWEIEYTQHIGVIVIRYIKDSLLGNYIETPHGDQRMRLRASKWFKAEQITEVDLAPMEGVIHTGRPKPITTSPLEKWCQPWRLMCNNLDAQVWANAIQHGGSVVYGNCPWGRALQSPGTPALRKAEMRRSMLRQLRHAMNLDHDHPLELRYDPRD